MHATTFTDRDWLAYMDGGSFVRSVKHARELS